MIGISKLLCGKESFGDKLRYIHGASTQKNGVNKGYGPVVVWNCTRTCNLKCKHCYADSDSRIYEEELSTEEAKKFIDDLHGFKVPVILFSGGEPFLRKDLFELIEYSTQRNIRSTISTNGTLIDKDAAIKLKQCGVGYVGISLDGIGKSHDEFRGTKGSFDNALRGIRNCREAGQKVGLRFTINKHNYGQLKDIFRLIEEEKINRVCFYHLVYSGRGSSMMNEDITHDEAREAMNLIIEKTMEMGDKVEILTVDNHADSVYLYLEAEKKCKNLSQNILKLMKLNGGNRSGIAIANVDYKGNVHPDQFTTQYTFGNVKERSFGDIWSDTSNSIIDGLKNRKNLLKGRCGICKWLEVCNGNFRARAEAVTGDFWASDPACYLTNEEIGVSESAGLI
ncbi:coenzyme PQQ synthesis protein E [Clostridium pasteurianum DSM 525 = ATCC 6013]|uniref:Mycofactocin maturase MftC n=1 Tax=Clostridium pasteurianum DSM 525 = ATCC 6013 TaxID=1262449 RepID=A0A0H3J3Q1_CLOPA|nr:putative heme d1 biosynthesis radical SAM protein NirJ1 [Clostridium pasteurianum]AJA46543.1 coenzyme PQQ synthesis protein E [Clostridium pasteurianum DSM 525 = ATCC 6013]AJA50531.1 coenzyme PQQ synthesis protein E [Clostridium pasteurianum DSM 525 = ATCC 6013]AOZ73967.1 radical SAM protein [Clostridium pasteurianum DSM 525 = ATCC 6013]AOZ77764.1 radical SAM protein [Clostridium pasteurianum]ELP61115.1 MoaA/NirJ family Fe-S oxidoreductase [Clostridium pasteurianum DSM 525 = ATCC 6013]